ncbi:MAG TPA: hypothetical protein VFO78_11495 [Candidatus Limnocylindrales bacterium]|nr:hypothetical protein [Candidatus Limnocylindrales bacterium]
MTGLDDQVRVHHREYTAEPTPEDLAERRHAELRLLLLAILCVSIVGVIFLAWDALD